jgi:hypothetical protein
MSYLFKMRIRPDYVKLLDLLAQVLTTAMSNLELEVCGALCAIRTEVGIHADPFITNCCP